MEQRTHQGGQPPCHVGGGRAHPPRARPLPWAHGGPPPLIPAPILLFFLPQTPLSSSSTSSSPFCCDFRSPAQGTSHKLLCGIVHWYVTPPMVQLVFVLVLYLLQIFAIVVTLFLSLHVKFIWSKVVLMRDIASRHLLE